LKNAAHTELTNAIIRFAGDSGDGIQLTGSMFTQDSAILGNDVSTLPDFPAEIRAPVGTRAGVSSFQLNFSSGEIHTPGDQPNALVALNPAALAVHLPDLTPGGILILDDDSFNASALEKAGYATSDPREDGSLRGYQVYRVPITSLTLEALRPLDLGKKRASLCKNMFTLGMVAWMFEHTVETVLAQIDKLADRKKHRPEMREKYLEEAQANKLALQAGYNYADTVEAFVSRYVVGKARLRPGTYRRVNGNEATALGCLAASTLSERPLFCAS